MSIIWKKILILCILIALGSVSKMASANCAGPNQPRLTPPTSEQLDLTAPVGATLWTGTLSAGASTGCSTGSGYTITATSWGTYLGNNLYATGITGIAYRFKFVSPTSGCLSSASGYWPLTCSISWPPGISASTVQVELVKTGPISPGNFESSGFAYLKDNVPGFPGGYVTYYEWGSTPVIGPTKPTCAVSQQSIAVSLGDVRVTQFTGVGSTSNAVPFTIALTCGGGSNGGSTNIYVTLTDNTNQSNRSDVLSLAPQSQAQGVGIQVLNGTTVVKYGPDSAAAGNTNQWLAGSTTGGNFNIPLTARYVQTGATVTPGPADGVATFTMSYQ